MKGIIEKLIHDYETRTILFLFFSIIADIFLLIFSIYTFANAKNNLYWYHNQYYFYLILAISRSALLIKYLFYKNKKGKSDKTFSSLLMITGITMLLLAFEINIQTILYYKDEAPVGSFDWPAIISANYLAFKLICAFIGKKYYKNKETPQEVFFYSKKILSRIENLFLVTLLLNKIIDVFYLKSYEISLYVCFVSGMLVTIYSSYCYIQCMTKRKKLFSKKAHF